MDYNDNFNDDYNDNDYNNGNNENKWVTLYRENKKLIIILLVIILGIIILSLITNKVDNSNKVNELVPYVTLESNSNSNSVTVGNSVIVNGKVENVRNGILSWTSSDSSICTVNSSGVVNTYKKGDCLIKASYKHSDGKEYSESIRISINEVDKGVSVQTLGFPDGELVITKGNNFKLPIVVVPSNANVSGVKYSTSNNSVCSVNSNGVLTGVGIGGCVVYLDYDNGKVTDSLDVYVTEDLVVSEIVESPILISFSYDRSDIKVGESKNLMFDYQPSNANTSSLIWSTSNDMICSVERGIVKAISVGNCTVTVKTLKGVSASTNINVVSNKVMVSDITILNGNTASINIGGNVKIESMVYPSNATNNILQFNSLNSSVCVVDQSGNVYGLSSGVCTVTIGEVESGITKTFTVTVNNQYSSSDNPGSSVDYPSVPSNPSTPSTPTVSSDANNTNECVSNCVEISTGKGAKTTEAAASKNPVDGPVKTTLRYRNASTINSFKYCVFDAGLTNNCSDYSQVFGGSVTFDLLPKTRVVTWGVKYVTYFNNGTYETRIRYLTLKAGSSTYTSITASSSVSCKDVMCGLETSFDTSNKTSGYSNVKINLTKSSAASVIRYDYKAVTSGNTSLSLGKTSTANTYFTLPTNVNDTVYMIKYQACDSNNSNCSSVVTRFIKVKGTGSTNVNVPEAELFFECTQGSKNVFTSGSYSEALGKNPLCSAGYFKYYNSDISKYDLLTCYKRVNSSSEDSSYCVNPSDKISNKGEYSTSVFYAPTTGTTVVYKASVKLCLKNDSSKCGVVSTKYITMKK